MNRLRQLLAPPVFEDEDKTRIASVLNTILLIILGILLLTAIPVLITSYNVGPSLVNLVIVLLLVSGVLFLMRRGRVQLASTLLASAGWLAITVMTFFDGGVHSGAFSTYILALLISSLLLGGRAGIGFAGLSVVSGLGMVYAENSGFLPPAITPHRPVLVWIGHSAAFIGASMLLYIAVRSINEAFERARRSNRELQAIRESLEERVTERTHELESSAALLAARGEELENALVDLQKREAELEEAVGLQEEARRRQEEINRELQAANEAVRRRSAYLQATAEVSQTITQTRDPNELLPQVTRLLSRYFGFYHVGIFLVDKAGRYAVLRAANSEGGQRMLARGHRLPVGEQGIVGYVTGKGEPRIALNVGADVVYFDNPDLPETRSEIALPLRQGDEIIGALDVQSTEPSAFDDQDVAVLQTLADQVSIALENAHLFAQTRAALAKAEAVHQQYLGQEWTHYAQRAPDLGYEYLLRGRENLAGQPLPAGDAAMARGTTVALSGDAGDQGAALAVPIKLHDQIIGVLDLQETEQDRHWSEEEIALAEAVAERLALTLESARLFEQTRARARREALTRQITERIRDAMDVDAMLQTAVQELGRALGAPRVYVRLATDAEVDAGGDGE